MGADKCQRVVLVLILAHAALEPAFVNQADAYVYFVTLTSLRELSVRREVATLLKSGPWMTPSHFLTMCLTVPSCLNALSLGSHK